MAVCDPTISNIGHGVAGPLDDSTTETISTDMGSDTTGSDTSTSMSMDKNGDSSCLDVRGNIRRSPRSSNPTNGRHNRNTIDMKTGVFDSREYACPHSHLDDTTMDLEEKLMTQENERVDARNCLENQMIAVALMKSVVETSERQKDKVVNAPQVKVGADLSSEDCDHPPTTESRVGVTPGVVSCENLPDAGNGFTNLVKCEDHENYRESPHVVDDSPLSPTSVDKNDPAYSGVYCGTRKRKRDAMHPDSPRSMEPELMSNTESKVLTPRSCGARSRGLKENGILDVNANSVAISSLGNKNGLRTVLNNSSKHPDVTNSSVPNPILGSPFGIGTEHGISGAGTADIMRQISTSDLNEMKSLVGEDSVRVKREAHASVNPHNVSMIKVENSDVSNNIAIDSLSSQYPPISVSISPKCPSLPESCPVKREEISTIPQQINGSTVSFVLQNHENNNESSPIFPRQRIFSVDLDPDVFDFDNGIGIHTESPTNGLLDTSPQVVPYDENKSLPHLGDKLDPNSTINRAANSSDKYNYVVDSNPDRTQRGRQRDRGMSFELFSFGLTADEPLPPTVSTHYGEYATGRFNESNIFDPVSFTDGGIHEETALSKSRPISMVLEENDEIELMNTPGFVEGPPPQSNYHLQPGIIKSVPNPVSSQLLYPHHGGNVLTSRVGESSTTSITSNIQYGHNISNAEPLAAYSSTAMDLPTMQNTEDEFLTMQDNTAAALLSQVLPSTLNGTVSHTACPMELLNKGGRIGIYLPVARKDRIAKFHSKRKMRIWRKRIKYDCRKKLADSRPRIKGRFVKSLEQDE